MKKEIFQNEITFEVTNEDDIKRLSGYAVKYDTLTSTPRTGPNAKLFYHRFEQGSFDKTLEQNKKIALIFSHNHEKPMASTSNDTLRITSDEIGLKFEAELVETSYSNDAWKLIDSGIISQMSFGVKPGKYETFEEEDKNILSHVEVENLYELSTVLFPAFSSSEVEAMEEVIEEEEAPKKYSGKFYKIKTDTLMLSQKTKLNK